MAATEKSKWLSVLVMQKYKEKNPPQENSRWNDLLSVASHTLGFNNANLQLVLDKLYDITKDPENIYGVFNAQTILRDPFAIHDVFGKMLALDCKKADAVKFFEDLISSFEQAYAERSFHTNLATTRSRDLRKKSMIFERFAQDAANSFIYLYVIPNLLLLMPKAENESETALIKSKLDNVREIIRWDSSCFFRNWIRYEKADLVKVMAQALYDDSPSTAQQIEKIKKNRLVYETVHPDFKQFWEDSQREMPTAFQQIFKIQTAVPPLPNPLPSVIPVPYSADQSIPSRRKHVTNGVHCDIIGNPYLIEIE